MSPVQESSTPSGKHQRGESDATDNEPAQKRMAGLPATSAVYTVELSTGSSHQSSTEPLKKVLSPSELVALFLNPEKSGTYSASKETYLSVLEALLHDVQETEHSADYKKVLGPKVFSISEERVSLARFLVQMAERRTEAAGSSSIDERARKDLQDASRFLKKQEAYRDMMQGVLRQFQRDKESLVRELEVKLRKGFGLKDANVRLCWGKLSDLLENARSRVKAGTQRVEMELEHEFSVASVAKELLVAFEGVDRSEQKGRGEASQVNIQKVIEAMDRDT